HRRPSRSDESSRPGWRAGWPTLGVNGEACQDRSMRHVALLAVALVLIVAATSSGAVPGTSVRADLIAAIQSYRAALERLIEFHAAAVSRASAEVDKRRELLARGIVSRLELEQSERALEAAEAK